MGYTLALASAFFFAASNVFFSKGLNQTAPEVNKQLALFITIMINNLVNVLVVGVTFAADRFSWPGLNLTALLCFIGGGFFTTFLGRYLSFNSIEIIGAARYGPLKITTPFFTVLIGVIFLHETIAPLAYLGIAAVLAGVYLISRQSGRQVVESPPGAGEDIPGEETPGEAALQAGRSNFTRGLILGILSGAIYGTGYVLRKIGVTYYPIPLVGVAIGSLTALLLNWFVLAVQKKMKLVFPALRVSMKTFFPGGLCTSLGLFAFFYALQLTPVSLTNSIAATEPLFIFLLTYFFNRNKEAITLSVFLSACAIIGGIILIYMAAP